MKNIFIFIVAALSFFSLSSFALEELPSSLKCQEGKYRLNADLIKNRINLFEMDPITQREHSVFGFAQTISNIRICLNRFTNPFYSLDLKIKNDGLIKGQFEANLDPEKKVRIGFVQYAGHFSWEPINFYNCELQY